MEEEEGLGGGRGRVGWRKRKDWMEEEEGLGGGIEGGSNAA